MRIVAARPNTQYPNVIGVTVVSIRLSIDRAQQSEPSIETAPMTSAAVPAMCCMGSIASDMALVETTIVAAFIVAIVPSHSHTLGRPSQIAVATSWTIADARKMVMLIDIIGAVPIRSTDRDDLHRASPITAPLIRRTGRTVPTGRRRCR